MRNGKIAKLPESVRNELNPRMERGESGTVILEWLNGLPVVRTLLKEEFDGAPISKQNLNEWRQGGFREWEVRRDVISQAVGMRGMNGKIDAPALVGDLMATIAVHYAGLMVTWNGELNPAFVSKARTLANLLRSFAQIPRTIQQLEKGMEHARKLPAELARPGEKTAGAGLPKVEELKAAGPIGSGVVKPSQTQSNQTNAI